MSSNSRNSRNSSKNDRVAQALGIYRSIAACNERLARGNDVHALTAALMLPCYHAEFRRVASELNHSEQDELGAALERYLPGNAAVTASYNELLVGLRLRPAR
ncbi:MULTISPECIES: hypothetical protein [Variovorax]|jgi:hypothetical protein|uniref:Uncharacterized protein n=2 Tax=Variovorax paradoxus TaxID=34073 RepID=A0AAW8EER2_VARPD|nr:hypothetical protein [Variovorax paradoxus]MDP9971102.1 hypothetical protein [Variovorax paradoxus]